MAKITLADEKPAVKRIESKVEAAVVIVEVALPKDLYDLYQTQSAAQGVSLEDAIVSRLRRCVEHDSVRGIYLKDGDRRKLESWLRKQPIETAAQFMAIIEGIFSLRVEPFDPISISGAAFKRAMLRDGFGGMSAQEHINKIVKDALVRALGVN
jgi:hypothetical protein